LIKNPVRIIVVVKCLILCSKFDKKLFVGRAEESGDGRAGGGVQDRGERRGEEGWGGEEERVGEESGRVGYPLQRNILAMALI